MANIKKTIPLVTPEVIIKEEKIETPKEMRERLLLEKGKTVESVGDFHSEYREYFAQIRHKLDLKRSLENVIWLHLVATNNATPEKFEDGFKSFGYKL